MESKIIQKYNKKTVSQLIKIATTHFNKFIRLRDQNYGCVSCNGRVEQAGHFYSGGHYSSLRFNPNNVHGQCIRCNMHLSANLNEYRRNIINRIGENGLIDLDQLADYYKRTPFKWDRFSLIQIIEEYKELNKTILNNTKNLI